MRRPSPIAFSIAALAAFTITSAAQSGLAGEHTTRIELTHGKPFVMVKVNGKGPFRFVIDTGTGAQAFVTPTLAEQLGLPTSGQVHLSDPSQQRAQSVPLVQIQTLQVAGVEFNNVQAVVHSLGSGDGYYEGLLGFPLFRDFLLTLDFPNRRITLASGALKPDGAHSVLPFRTLQGLPIVSLSVGKVNVDTEIDSGGDGLSLPEEIAPRLKYLNDPVPFGRGESLSTRFQIKTARLAMDVHVGSYTFARPCVEINGAFPLANFGSSAMHDFALTFDQKNHLVRFDATRKSHELAAAPTPLRMVNMPPPEQPDPSLLPVD